MGALIHLRLPWSILPRGAAIDYFVQQIINGVTVGCIYALVAMGYTLVHGITS